MMFGKSYYANWNWVGVIACLTVGLSAHAQKMGDVNHDGIVSICDAMLIQNHIQGVSKLLTNNLALPLADMNTNGTIANDDLLLVIDTILGRTNLQDFDTNLLSFEDGDGFSFLEDWHHGANPYNSHSLDPKEETEDEVYVRRRGMVILAQPPVEVYRYTYSEGGAAIVMAQPPVKVFRTQAEQGISIVLAQPPVRIIRAQSEGGVGAVLAQPPVQVLRTELENEPETLLVYPPPASMQFDSEAGEEGKEKTTPMP